MTDYAKQVFAALATGLVLSVIVSAVSEVHPEFGWLAAVLFFGGLALALYDFYMWISSSTVDSVYVFVLGAVNAAFGLASALATTEVLIQMFVVAAIIDIIAGVASRIIDD